MRGFWRAMAVVAFAVLAPALAAAQKRVALVIGNDRYPNLADGQQLHNAVSDARAMKATLAELGFDVLDGENLDRAGMIGRLSTFASRLEPDDIAFFFYAGHGVALNGQNYILPSDIAAPQATGRDDEERLADLAVPETRITDRLKGAKVAVVVLDSCRDNPFAASVGRSIGTGRGLARPPETRGILSIYSAGIGQQALDRLGVDDTNPNSVFTRVFVDALKQPGIGLREAAFKTQGEVASLAGRSGQDQVPGVYSQILGDDVVLGAAAAAKRGPPGPAPVDPPGRDLPAPAVADNAAGDFKFAESIASAAGWQAFLRAHPEGPLADVAKGRLVALREPTAEPKRPPAQEARREPQDEPPPRRDLALPIPPRTLPPPPVAAFVVGSLDPTGDNFLALRSAPTGSATLLRKLPPGTPLSVDDHSGAWTHVTIGGGESGWVYGRYVVPNAASGHGTPPLGPVPSASYAFVTGLDAFGDNFLALKAAPDIRSARVTTMGPGTKLRIVGRSGDWVEVRMLDGTSGWASARYVGCCTAR